jgi:hypothetical protein
MFSQVAKECSKEINKKSKGRKNPALAANYLIKD